VFKSVGIERMDRFADWDKTPWEGIVLEKEITLKIWFLDSTKLMINDCDDKCSISIYEFK